MRHTFLFLLLLALFSPSAGFAKKVELENVRRAQALLGSETWSRIVLIHPDHQRRGANHDVYALIFEFSGILWFYDAQGTQSFSLSVGDLEHEKTDFQPLLRAVDPRYTRFEFVDSESDPGSATRGSITNGCFIESIAVLQARLKSGERIERARLLSYYQDMYGDVIGHTVLTYETPEGAYVIDPQWGLQPTRLARTLPEDPSRVARSLQLPYLLVQARWIEAPLSGATKIARADSGHSGSS